MIERREVVFQSLSSDLIFKTRSTVQTKENPNSFYTGKHKIMDAGSRVDKFKKRYGK